MNTSFINSQNLSSVIETLESAPSFEKLLYLIDVRSWFLRWQPLIFGELSKKKPFRTDGETAIF